MSFESKKSNLTSWSINHLATCINQQPFKSPCGHVFLSTLKILEKVSHPGLDGTPSICSAAQSIGTTYDPMADFADCSRHHPIDSQIHQISRQHLFFLLYNRAKKAIVALYILCGKSSFVLTLTCSNTTLPSPAPAIRVYLWDLGWTKRYIYNIFERGCLKSLLLSPRSSTSLILLKV